ncbi:MAG: DUF72 domain-containing protein [Bryobacteraceae bacterium]|nr:DUF72 domain-containing protein [Bryobacteraceae bacterium]MDW8379886.1 DUF72 domain-containing protein [Bryobacterales bacterium]
MAKLYAGASGFAYDSWKPDFYPPGTPSKHYLSVYSRRLNAVEINYTFRRLPSVSTLENWTQATPENFRFALKAHQRITHLLRLQPSNFTELFFQTIHPLHTVKRLGPVLFQLPPNFKRDGLLLEQFLSAAPAGLHYAFEFRHPSWLTSEIYRVLGKFGAALCLAESDEFAVPDVVTAPFVYFRLRKAEYSPAERQAVKAKVQSLLAQGLDVYVFFKHEETPSGALYAEELLRP